MDQISPDLNNFIYETARIHHAVAPILPSRVADQDLNFNGITIPKGSLLGVNATTIHLHPQYWDDPDQFNPDRWLKENKQAEKKHKFGFIPFSAGPRQCLGMEFSLMEQRIVVIKILQKYKLVAPKTDPFLVTKNILLLTVKPFVHCSLEER